MLSGTYLHIHQPAQCMLLTKAQAMCEHLEVFFLDLGYTFSVLGQRGIFTRRHGDSL